jgi:hypothetical protein
MRAKISTGVSGMSLEETQEAGSTRQTYVDMRGIYNLDDTATAIFDLSRESTYKRDPGGLESASRFDLELG